MAGRAAVFMGIKYGTGDVIAQSAAAGPSVEIDRKRASYFWLFGTYYGVINYNVFRLLAMSPWPVTPWPKAVFSALMDGCVHVPISFYPQFYFVKELVASSESRPLHEHFHNGMSKYMTNWYEDVLASAAVFGSVGILNFRCVPATSMQILTGSSLLVPT